MKKLVFLFLLAGCASSSETHLPDGSMGYSLNCSGSARSWGMCLEKAGSLCGARGYDVVASTGDQGAIIGGGSTVLAGGSVITRNMLIRCK